MKMILLIQAYLTKPNSRLSPITILAPVKVSSAPRRVPAQSTLTISSNVNPFRPRKTIVRKPNLINNKFKI